MYGSMEESTPASEAPALGPAELKAVRKLLATNGDDARSAGLSGACLDMSTGKAPYGGCCSRCGDGGCASGYTYAGQFVTSLEMVTSTYPDFFPFCGYMPNCGNTCCVPSDE